MRGADLVIHDAQYTTEEYPARLGWGHSTVDYATDAALAAGARQLALFHHDPTHQDEMLDELEVKAKTRASVAGGLDVFMAREGMTLEVTGQGHAPAVAGGSALRRRPIAGRRVLVVSPNEGDVEAITQGLVDDNLVILSVPSREAALSQAAEMAPDLVIIHHRLPDGDGAGLIRPLRRRLGRRSLPAILLTSLEGDGGAVPVGAGATDYIAMPFSPTMLRTRVRVWLSRSQARPRRKTAGGAENAAGQRTGLQAGAGDGRSPSHDHVDMPAAVPLFRPLTRDQLQLLAARASEQVFETGRVIIRQGDRAGHVLLILSGRVRVIEALPDSPQLEMFLGEIGPGEVVGELAILSERARSASVIALERTRCLVLPQEEFLQLVRSSSDVATGLLRVLADRIYDANRLLARHAPDPLTGLANRRAFQDQYRRLAEGARRRSSPVLLLLIDVLDLKHINDRFGHAAGDDVLRTVADTLMQTTRSTDLVARYGGDEFVALLESAGADDAPGLVTRVRRKLAEIGPRRGLPDGLEYSIGIALSLDPPETADDLLRLADLDMRRRGVVPAPPL